MPRVRALRLPSRVQGAVDGSVDWRHRTLARPSRPTDPWSARMARVVVDVMLKPEILDPQGQAVAGALPRLGFTGITSVRQGKRFELEVEGEVTDEVLARIREAAVTVLSNPVIEDVVGISVETPASA